MRRLHIPAKEQDITDEQIFSAFDLGYQGLEEVKQAWESHDLQGAKRALINYLEKRSNVNYLYDYRQLPLRPIDTDECPYSFQSSLGLDGSLKEFCLFTAHKMMDHIYVPPGKGRREIDLGTDFEHMIHFNFIEDQGKRHRHALNMIVRGQFFESLCVLYHEEGSPLVLSGFEEILKKFLETYPLNVVNTSPSADRFQYDEDRDVMSAGWLAMVYLSLFYTRVPYELQPETAFEIIKRVWFLGIQFRRFDEDGYRPYNHHMWERGLVPFLLGTLLPEIPDFAEMKSHGTEVVCRHIKEDFNEHGGYNEHSIAYWSGAAIGEMLYRGICIARRNDEPILDSEAENRMTETFHVLAQIAAPGDRFPSIGDNGGPLIDPILKLGVKMLEDPYCRELLEVRGGQSLAAECRLPLDYCNDKTGFVCGRSDYSCKANYFLMSAKTNCGYSGHNHMDMLSLCLTIGGEDIIGEPYADKLYHAIKMGSETRGYMYNMEAHNSVLAYGKPILPNSVYANKWGVYRPDSPITDSFSTAEGMYAAGYHNAYTFCSHKREVLFHRQKGLLVCDRVERGNRLSKAHIQRWNLQPNTVCTRLSQDAVMLQKGKVRVLCLWLGASELRIWKNECLYPEIVSEKEKLFDIIDVSFRAAEEKKSDNITVSLQVLMLDITDMNLEELTKERYEELRRRTGNIVEVMNTPEALERFGRIDQFATGKEETV